MPRKPPPKTRQAIALDLPADLHAAVKERATAEDRTMAATIRRACYHYLKCEQAPGGEG